MARLDHSSSCEFGRQLKERKGAAERMCHLMLVTESLRIAFGQPAMIGTGLMARFRYHYRRSPSSQFAYMIRFQLGPISQSPTNPCHNHLLENPRHPPRFRHTRHLFSASSLNIRIMFNPSHSTRRNPIPHREASTSSPLPTFFTIYRVLVKDCRRGMLDFYVLDSESRDVGCG